jgi:hypothetical protein
MMMKTIKEFFSKLFTPRNPWERYLESSVDIYDLEYRQRELTRKNAWYL